MLDPIAATSLSSETSFLTESVIAADLGVVPWVLWVVDLVVDLAEITSLVQSMKMQGSKRSLGTPPKTKAKLAIRKSVIFMMWYQKKKWKVKTSAFYTLFEICMYLSVWYMQHMIQRKMAHIICIEHEKLKIFLKFSFIVILVGQSHLANKHSSFIAAIILILAWMKRNFSKSLVHHETQHLIEIILRHLSENVSFPHFILSKIFFFKKWTLFQMIQVIIKQLSKLIYLK